MVKLEITKEKFVSLIKSIEDQLEHDREYCTKLGEVLHPHIELYDNSLLYEAIIELLEEVFDDKGGWINYFCWELNFGEAYEVGCATRKDGSNIDLSSAETLYEFLIGEYFIPGDKVVFRGEPARPGMYRQFEVIKQVGDLVSLKDGPHVLGNVHASALRKNK